MLVEKSSRKGKLFYSCDQYPPTATTPCGTGPWPNPAPSAILPFWSSRPPAPADVIWPARIPSAGTPESSTRIRTDSAFPQRNRGSALQGALPLFCFSEVCKQAPGLFQKHEAKNDDGASPTRPSFFCSGGSARAKNVAAHHSSAFRPIFFCSRQAFFAGTNGTKKNSFRAFSASRPFQ